MIKDELKGKVINRALLSGLRRKVISIFVDGYYINIINLIDLPSNTADQLLTLAGHTLNNVWFNLQIMEGTRIDTLVISTSGPELEFKFMQAGMGSDHAPDILITRARP